MKILKANAGPLTNFEVYDFLRKRGASTDAAERVMLTKLRPSELQVFDYLVKTPACNQTRESIIEFMEKCKEYDLAKAEVVNVTNIRPVESVEALPCIEYCTKRMDDRLEEFQTMVNTVLPPHPYPRVSDEEAAADDSADQEIPEEEMDAS